MLHQGRAALDPIAVVAIEDGAELADLGLVDMAADDAVDPAPARLFGQRPLEIVDIADGFLDPALQIGGERPIIIAELAAPEIVPVVDGQEEVVGLVAQYGEPTGVFDDAV